MERKRRGSHDMVRRRSSAGRKRSVQGVRTEKAMVGNLTHRLSVQAATLPGWKSAVGEQAGRDITERLAALVEGVPWNALLVLVVLADICLFFLQASSQTQGDLGGRDGAIAEIVVVAVVFSVEMVVKVLVYGWAGVLASTWNSVDFLVCVVTDIGAALEVVYGTQGTDGDADNALVQSVIAFCRGVMMIRVVRVLRLVRLVVARWASPDAATSPRGSTTAAAATDLGDIMLPLLACLDVLSRCESALDDPRLVETMGDSLKKEDVTWVRTTLQNDSLYKPSVQLDASLPEEVKGLLGAGPGLGTQMSTRFGVPPPPSPIAASTMAAALSIPFNTAGLKSFVADPLRWDLDAEAALAWTKEPLTVVAFHHIYHLGLYDLFKLDDTTLVRWLRAVEAGYREGFTQPVEERPIVNGGGVVGAGGGGGAAELVEMPNDNGHDSEAKRALLAGESKPDLPKQPTVPAHDHDLPPGPAPAAPAAPAAAGGGTGGGMVYHNNVRQASVVNDVAYFLHVCGVSSLLTSLESLALMLAAVIMDYRHPGLSNAHLIRSSHPLSLEYNDKSVLENHHVSSALRLFDHKGMGVLEPLSPADVGQLRSMLITLVLATDMAQHYAILTKLSAKLISNEPAVDLYSPADRMAVMCCLLHASDLSMATKPFGLFDKWTRRQVEENWLQGARERRLNLPVSMYMDRSMSEEQILRFQLGTLNVVVLPLFECVGEVLRCFCAAKDGAGKADAIIKALEKNRSKVQTAQRLMGEP